MGVYEDIGVYEHIGGYEHIGVYEHIAIGVYEHIREKPSKLLPSVYEHIGEEPPSLVSPSGVVHQRTIGGARGHRLHGQIHVYCIENENCYLQKKTVPFSNLITTQAPTYLKQYRCIYRNNFCKKGMRSII